MIQLSFNTNILKQFEMRLREKANPRTEHGDDEHLRGWIELSTFLLAFSGRPAEKAFSRTAVESRPLVGVLYFYIKQGRSSNPGFF